MMRINMADSKTDSIAEVKDVEVNFPETLSSECCPGSVLTHTGYSSQYVCNWCNEEYCIM